MVLRLWEKRLHKSIDDLWASEQANWSYAHEAVLLFLLIAARRKFDQSLLVVAKDNQQADYLMRELTRYNNAQVKKQKLTYIPQVEGQLRKQWIPENESARCAALFDLVQNIPGLYLTTAQALIAKVAPPEFLRENSFLLKRGQQISLEELVIKLIKLDYDNEAEVSMPGEISRRGGILDIYSPLYDLPVRLEFWGDEIDSIRFFSPENQRSVREIEEVMVIPRGEALTLSTGELLTNLFAYLPKEMLMILCDPEIVEEGFKTFSPEELSLWQEALQKRPPRLKFYGADNLILPDDLQVPPCQPIMFDHQEQQELMPWRTESLLQTLQSLQAKSTQIIVTCQNMDDAAYFKRQWDEIPQSTQLSLQITANVYLRNLYFPKQQIAFVADFDLLGNLGYQAPIKRHYHLRQAQEGEWNEPEKGDLAVHVLYGICRYQGVKEIEINGEVQEVLSLEFADEAVLYIQPEQITLISRYIGGTKKMPKLAKIGSNSWKKSCAEAGKAAWDLAAEMLRIEAMRTHLQGFSAEANPQWESDFAATFPYQETEDQARAISEVLADLSKDIPMDRLLCGDVGYGKTEVAIRAAFRTVLNKKQVAILVPTTILAQQHYENFRQRMGQFPITIEVLSRFKTKKEQQQILQRTAEGKVDILIGTHRLIQSDVLFNDLGLLVIDEEQRFGVTHKQRLKELRASVDILTMTATPIPRTLYLSLSGIRHLSTLMTAPVERLPVTTITATYNKPLIREAILREIERGGQVYFLHNRVQSIEKTTENLRVLVPEATFEFAHGQLADDELETQMSRFIAHEFDVLVCTTIIESGLDIPNANTIIIEHAERFGLAELYQLRGRVGRYHYQAYAYLLLPPSGVLPSDARQRIAAMRKFTHLGAGFKLAMRDLEIRGAGNILGAQQSGYIAAVGFDMYCQLLKDAIARLEQKPVVNRQPVPLHLDQLSFGLQADRDRQVACIPKVYIQDEELRLRTYRQLAMKDSEAEIDDFSHDLRDRFGPLPHSVELLLLCTKIKFLARQKNILSISLREQRLAMETEQGFCKINGSLPMLKSKKIEEQLREIITLLQSKDSSYRR